MDSVIVDFINKKVETPNLDYKEGFTWSKENRDKQFELIRDILAMANTRDGGTIILGVKDDTRELVGVSQEIWDSFDQSSVAEMAHRYGKPKVNIQVIKTEVQKKRVVAFMVTEFEDVPIICADTITMKLNNQRPILRKSAVYIRTSAAITEEISSDQDMRELLSRAMLKRGDELLRSVERLIKGKPLNPTEESINLYRDEVRQAEDWFKDVLQKGFQTSPRWELITHPSQYLPERVPNLPDLERLIKESQVSLRGWPFPYLGSQENQSAFNKGFQGHVDTPDIREGFRFYKSGQFIFKRVLWEDLKGYKTEKGKATLSFINAIYNLTEWLLFLARLHEAMGTTDSVRLQVNLIGCKNRQLASFDARVHLHSEWYESQEDIICFQRDYTVEELRASPKAIAVNISKHIFYIFNVKDKDIADEHIEQWQKTLLTRTY
jgi:hypothetical protein